MHGRPLADCLIALSWWDAQKKKKKKKSHVCQALNHALSDFACAVRKRALRRRTPDNTPEQDDYAVGVIRSFPGKQSGCDAQMFA